MRKTNLITKMPPTLPLIDAAGEIGLVCSTQNARRVGFPFSGTKLGGHQNHAESQIWILGLTLLCMA
jgi:hypothetical protein